MSDYFDQGKNLYTLNGSKVDSLQTLAESSFGDYTNILRNYLFMVYDVFIPWSRESALDSLRSRSAVLHRPDNRPVYTLPELTVSPNPFSDNIEIQGSKSENEEITYLVSVFNLEGKLVYSSNLIGGTGQLNLGDLEPGFYILKIANSYTGKVEVKRIFKNNK